MVWLHCCVATLPATVWCDGLLTERPLRDALPHILIRSVDPRRKSTTTTSSAGALRGDTTRPPHGSRCTHPVLSTAWFRVVFAAPAPPLRLDHGAAISTATRSHSVTPAAACSRALLRAADSRDTFDTCINSAIVPERRRYRYRYRYFILLLDLVHSQ
jgi:hypothetical protein